MAQESNINREYKDRLFKRIFGNAEKKEWTLSLYNAMNGSNYSDPEAIQLNTIEDAVYMGMKNDVSFLIADTFNLYEHQSSFNPNMPMRFLIYAGMLYDKYIQENKEYHRYSSVQQKAPTLKCVCFYNGTKKMGDRLVLRLSDAFDPNTKSDIEVTVTMININYGHNSELLAMCKPLEDYSYFVHEVRAKRKPMGSLEKAVDAAIEALADDSPIKPFLIANQAEVKNLFITEYDEERYRADLKAEGRAEGIAEGRAEGIAEKAIDIASNMLRLGLLSKENIALATGLPLETIDQLAAQGV